MKQALPRPAPAPQPRKPKPTSLRLPPMLEARIQEEAKAQRISEHRLTLAAIFLGLVVLAKKASMLNTALEKLRMGSAP